MQISIATTFPSYQGPKLHAPNSIAQGDTITNGPENDDNLPGVGGGVVAMKAPLYPSVTPVLPGTVKL